MFKRKLTNILKRTESNGVDLSDMQWSVQSYTLGDIVDNFKLPLVVRCSDATPTVEHGDQFRFDLAEPLLLHSRKWTRKIRVSCLQREASSGQITEIHPQYVIPEDYEGWFQVINSPSEKSTPDTTLESVIESEANQFLSAKSLSCLSLVATGNESPRIVRRHVKSGEFFTVRGLYEGKRKQSAQIKTKYDEIRNDGRTRPSDKILICADEKDESVLIDVTQGGCFYRIFESEENGRGLLKTEDLIDKKDQFPLLIRHTFGELPIIASTYSSVMKCVRVIEEQSVLAATLNCTATLLELQCKSPIRFKICLNDAILKNSENCTEALHICENEGDDFLSGIKIAFTIQKQYSQLSEQAEGKPKLTHKTSNSTSEARTATSNDSEEIVSMYDSFSDFGEEDANSEFSFAWTPEPLIKNRNNVKEEKSKASKDEKKLIAPKFFNSSLNSPMSSKESKLNAWNEQPDVV